MFFNTWDQLINALVWQIILLIYTIFTTCSHFAICFPAIHDLLLITETTTHCLLLSFFVLPPVSCQRNSHIVGGDWPTIGRHFTTQSFDHLLHFLVAFCSSRDLYVLICAGDRTESQLFLQMYFQNMVEQHWLLLHHGGTCILLYLSSSGCILCSTL